MPRQKECPKLREHKVTKWDPIEYFFYCTLMLLLLVGLKMAGYGRNM